MNYPSYTENPQDSMKSAGMIESMASTKAETQGVLSEIYSSLESKNARLSSMLDRLENLVEAVSRPEEDQTAGPTPRPSMPSFFENNMADLLAGYELRLARFNDIMDRIRL